VSAIHVTLADQVQRLGELTEQPGRLTELINVSALSLATGVPIRAVVSLLKGAAPPEAPPEVLQNLVMALDALLQDLEVAPVHATPPHRSIRCARHLPADQLHTLEEWARKIMETDSTTAGE
jgi:hypothetical protein